MPRVRLPVWLHGADLHYTDPAAPGPAVRLAALRVMAAILVGPDPAPGVADTRMSVNAVLDTGAPFSLIDGGTWELFDRLGLVEFLTPAGPLPPLTVGGTVGVGYRLGRIWVAVAPPSPGHPRANLPAVPVVFQLLDVTLNLRQPIILGLNGGVLDGRELSRTRVPVSTGPANRNDAGPAHGQDWFLDAP